MTPTRHPGDLEPQDGEGLREELASAGRYIASLEGEESSIVAAHIAAVLAARGAGQAPYDNPDMAWGDGYSVGFAAAHVALSAASSSPPVGIDRELREAAKRASPGPWTLGRSSEDSETWHPQVWPAFGAPILSTDGRPSGRVGAPEKDAADCAFIVLMENYVRAALSADRLAGDAGRDVTDGLYLAVQMTAKEQDRLRDLVGLATDELRDLVHAGWSSHAQQRALDFADSLDRALAAPAPREAD